MKEMQIAAIGVAIVLVIGVVISAVDLILGGLIVVPSGFILISVIRAMNSHD